MLYNSRAADGSSVADTAATAFRQATDQSINTVCMMLNTTVDNDTDLQTNSRQQEEKLDSDQIDYERSTYSEPRG